MSIQDDWNHCCAVCGRNQCEAHHLIPRENEATRYCLVNGIALCSQHHRFDAKVSPHQNAEGWIQWLEEHHPLRREWLRTTILYGEHLAFNGIKNHFYYIGVIERFREYVTPEEFTRIVGVKFNAYLTEQSMKGE